MNALPSAASRLAAPPALLGVLFEDLTAPRPVPPVGVELERARQRAVLRFEEGIPATEPPPGYGRAELMDHQRAHNVHVQERTGIEQRLTGTATDGRSWWPTAVVVHRHEWMRTQLALHLDDLGVRVVCATDAAIDTVAAVVAEQPHLVLMTDHVGGARGPDLLRRVQALCPTATIAVQVESDADARHLQLAGVSAVYSRRMRPRDVAASLTRLLPGNDDDAA